MTTLIDVLSGETNPAVIFGHIHRRAQDFARRLRLGGHIGPGIEYTRADAAELLDIVTIREFEERLQSVYTVKTDKENYAHARAAIELRDVCASAGLSLDEIRQAAGFGDRLGMICIFGADWSGIDVYYDINPARRELEAA